MFRMGVGPVTHDDTCSSIGIILPITAGLSCVVGQLTMLLILTAMHQFVCHCAKHIQDVPIGHADIQRVCIRIIATKTVIACAPLGISVQVNFGHGVYTQFRDHMLNKIMYLGIVIVFAEHLGTSSHTIF